MTERQQVIANLLYIKRDYLEGSDADKTIDRAVELLKDPDRVKVVRCSDCRFWEPPTDIEADDGSTAGHCRNDYAPCQNQQTDMNWFCADGERE